MSAIRLYLDADVTVELAIQLRRRGIDAVSATESRRTRWSDADQLAYAVRERRTLFTHNRDDFTELSVEYFERGTEHFGIIIAPQYDLAQLFRLTMNLAE